jgi:hypothetical protein
MSISLRRYSNSATASASVVWSTNVVTCVNSSEESVYNDPYPKWVLTSQCHLVTWPLKSDAGTLSHK